MYTVGGIPDRVDVRLDPALLTGFGLTLDDLRDALQAANASSQEARVTRDNLSIPVQAGTLLATVGDVRRLVVGMHEGAAVHLDDVAEVRRGGTVPDQSVLIGFGPDGQPVPGADRVYPAVTLAVAKKPARMPSRSPAPSASGWTVCSTARCRRTSRCWSAGTMAKPPPTRPVN